MTFYYTNIIVPYLTPWETTPKDSGITPTYKGVKSYKIKATQKKNTSQVLFNNNLQSLLDCWHEM